MAISTPRIALTAAALLAATAAYAQPLTTVDSPQATAPAVVPPQPAARALPSVGAPQPLALPPASIDDILDQQTDVEPEEAPPPPPAELGLTAEQLDTRIRGASAAAQVLQGPMDGAWSLEGTGGEALYTFQFVDSPGAAASLEGAWRDLRRGEGLGGTGLIANVLRNGGMLQASFYPKGGVETAAVSLIQQGDGGWAGQLTQGGATIPVRMIRSEPMLTHEPIRGAGAGVVSPYRAASANQAAPARKVVKKKAVKKRVAKKPVRKKAPAKKKA